MILITNYPNIQNFSTFTGLEVLEMLRTRLFRDTGFYLFFTGNGILEITMLGNRDEFFGF